MRFVDDGQADPARIAAVITRELDDVVAEMSAWAPGSALSRFNDAPSGTWHVLPPGLRTVLHCALATAAETGGAFDPTIAPLTGIWGFGPVPVPPGLPDTMLLAAARARCGYHRLRIDEGRAFQPGLLGLDVSGIGKGHAVDRVAERLQGIGIASLLVEIGGELRGHGVKPDGMPWWVELETPPGAGIATFRVALHDCAVATSGDYRRFFEIGGRRYAHTIDPRTGWPAGTGLASVTVLDGSCMRADARATALTVLGLDAGMAHARRHGIAALFLARARDGYREHLSPALAAMRD